DVMFVVFAFSQTTCLADSLSQVDCASSMHALNVMLELGSSGSQQGGGAESQGGPKTPSSHCTWQFVTALVQRRVERMMRSANFAPSVAIFFWQRLIAVMSAEAALGRTRSSVASRSRFRRAMAGVLPRVVVDGTGCGTDGARLPRGRFAWQGKNAAG